MTASKSNGCYAMGEFHQAQRLPRSSPEHQEQTKPEVLLLPSLNSFSRAESRTQPLVSLTVENLVTDTLNVLHFLQFLQNATLDGFHRLLARQLNLASHVLCTSTQLFFDLFHSLQVGQSTREELFLDFLNLSQNILLLFFRLVLCQNDWLMSSVLANCCAMAAHNNITRHAKQGQSLTLVLCANLHSEPTLESLLKTIDTTPLMASTKIWLYHHFVTTKVGCSLLINGLCLSFVKELQAAATRSLKRWVGLPRCANTSILFLGGPRQCGLKVRNLVTVWKQQQSIKLNLLEASADERCQFLAKSISDRQSNWTRTCQFASAREAQIAKTVVLANSESTAPFHPTFTTDPPLSPRSTRKRVNQYIHDIDVAEQLEHLRTLQVQGKWLQWSERMHQDLSWQQLIHNWSDAELRFALQATTDTAPSATNLRRWGVANIDPACCLCGKPATSRHVLNACAVALQLGLYTWRNDSVLSVLRYHLHKFWELPATQRAVEVTMASRSNRFIRFVPAGTTLPLQSSLCIIGGHV